MNLKFLSLFVKNIDDNTASVRQKCGKAAGIIGIASNILLFVVKLIIGIASSSISIMADAVNNITDAGSAVITLIGFKLSEKPADDEHPYGHARIEYLSGFIVSLIIAVLGVQFFKDSISAIIENTVTEYSIASIIILVIAVLVKLWQASFYKSVGKHIESSSLIATAADGRNDVISTCAVLAGAVVSRLFEINIDGYLGLLIAIFIIYSGIKLIIETADPILGSAPDDELINAISEKIMSYDGVLGIHDLIIHNYGKSRCFASVHCEVPASEDIPKSHDIIDNIEFDFLRNEGIQLVIHIDPVVTDDPRVTELKKATSEIIAELTHRLHEPISMHDFRVVFGQTHTNLNFDILINNSCKTDSRIICDMIESELKKISPEYNTVINVDRNYTTSILHQNISE